MQSIQRAARHLSEVSVARLQLPVYDLEETILSDEPRSLNRLYWGHSYLKQAEPLEWPLMRSISVRTT